MFAHWSDRRNVSAVFRTYAELRAGEPARTELDLLRRTAEVATKRLGWSEPKRDAFFRVTFAEGYPLAVPPKDVKELAGFLVTYLNPLKGRWLHKRFELIDSLYDSIVVGIRNAENS